MAKGIPWGHQVASRCGAVINTGTTECNSIEEWYNCCLALLSCTWKQYTVLPPYSYKEYIVQRCSLLETKVSTKHYILFTGRCFSWISGSNSSGYSVGFESKSISLSTRIVNSPDRICSSVSSIFIGHRPGDDGGTTELWPFPPGPPRPAPVLSWKGGWNREWWRHFHTNDITSDVTNDVIWEFVAAGDVTEHRRDNVGAVSRS